MKRTDLNEKSKRNCYCFTYNNYTADGEEKLKQWLTDNCKYAVYGHETGESGNPHLQGYMNLTKQKSIKTIQNQLTSLGIKLALLTSRGSAASNRDYCTKSGDRIFEHGNIKITGQGTRNDLNECVDAVKAEQLNMEQIAERFPVVYVKYSTGLSKLKNLLDKKLIPEYRDITVTVYYGEGGTGKTLSAVEMCRKLKIEYYILSPPNNNSVWYDNYSGESALILDDYYGWITPHDLYRILDNYRHLIPIKGSHTWALWKYVFITSNVHPEKFYKEKTMARLDQTAYNRRFHNIYNLQYYGTDKSAVLFPIVEKELKKITYVAPPRDGNNTEKVPVSNTTPNDESTNAAVISGYATDSGTEEEELSLHSKK